MFRLLWIALAVGGFSSFADTPALVRSQTGILADFAETQLLIFHERIYEKHFKKFTFNVPVLLYSEQGVGERLPGSATIQTYPDTRNRVFRVTRPIDRGTLWARDVTPFTVTNEKGQKGLVTYYPWLADSSSYGDWLNEPRDFGPEAGSQERRAKRAKWNGSKAAYAPRELSEIVFENQTTLFGETVYHFIRHMPLNIEGGNLVVTGSGACFVSRDVFISNYLYRRSEVKRLLMSRLGCTSVHIVEEPSWRSGDVDSSHADWSLSVLSPSHLWVSGTASKDIGRFSKSFAVTTLPGTTRFGVQMLQVNGDYFLPDLGEAENKELRDSLLRPFADCAGSVANSPFAPRRILFENVSEEVREKGAGIHCMSGQLH